MGQGVVGSEAEEASSSTVSLVAVVGLVMTMEAADSVTPGLVSLVVGSAAIEIIWV